jgi:hypothetical protein
LKEKATTTVTETGDAVTIVWTAATANGSAITTYNIYYTASDATTATKANADNVTATEYTLDAKKVALGKIKFYVTATNIKGTSANSDTVEIYSANKPAAPTALAATVAEDKSKITLTWTAAANNGAPITGHTFKNIVNPTTGKTATPTSVTTAATTKDFPAEAGNTYSFQVAATNMKGTGPDTAAVLVDVPSNVSVVE